MRAYRLRFRTLLPALPLLLFGCGGEDAPEPASAPEAAPEAAPPAEPPPPTSGPQVRGDTVEVLADEYVFGFATLTVPEGRVVFELENRGAEYHNLVIMQGDSVVFFPDEDAVPDQTVAYETTLAAGEYHVVCTIVGHEDRGMHEVLTVTPAENEE